MIRLAVCQYAIRSFSCWDDYAAAMRDAVSKAQSQAADILLLPEYAGMEAACQPCERDLELFALLQDRLVDYCRLFQRLSNEYQMCIQPGTILVQEQSKLYRNRAYFFEPGGKIGYQDKLQLTTSEKTTAFIEPGDKTELFETPWGPIGILICYDSEFPEIARSLTTSGAKLLLVPSYTASLAGYHRVSLSCRARALENQCFVGASFVVGPVSLTEPPDHTVGQAGIWGPVDVGFPDTGIIAEGVLNQTQMLVSPLSFRKLDQVRKKGEVRNWADFLKTRAWH